jgi:hypothetical protein
LSSTFFLKIPLDKCATMCDSVLMVKDADKRHTAIRLDADDLAKLEVIAKEQDRSVSWLIRKAVSEFLERQKKK